MQSLISNLSGNSYDEVQKACEGQILKRIVILHSGKAKTISWAEALDCNLKKLRHAH